MIEQLYERLSAMEEDKAKTVARIAISICEIVAPREDRLDAKYIPCHGESLTNPDPSEERMLTTARHVLDNRQRETTWLERATCLRYLKGEELVLGDLDRMRTLVNTYWWEAKP